MRKRKAAAIAAGVALISATVGCAPGAADPDESSDGGRGDTYTFAWTADLESMNPALSNNGAGAIILNLVYEPLIRLGVDGELIPALATEWAYVDGDPTLFELSLREDALFSDGTPVTADAVASSMEYFLANNGPLVVNYANLSGVESVDEDTVRISLSQPTPQLETLLTQNFLGASIISPAGVEDPDSLGSETAGAGPYILDSADSIVGDHYTFVANDNYYNPDQIHWDEIEVRVIADPGAMLAAIQTGQVDVGRGDGATVEQAGASLEVQTIPATVQGFFVFDMEGQLVPALADDRVRQAMNYAIDRDSIADAIFKQTATPLRQMNRPGTDMYSEALEDDYPFDPERARKLLDEAGWADGFTIPLVSVGALAQNSTLVQAAQANLEDVGIELAVTNVNTFPEFFAAIDTGQYAMGSASNRATDAAFYVPTIFQPGGSLNPFDFNDPNIDDTMSAAAGMTDAEERRATYESVGARVMELAWGVPVVANSLILYSGPAVDVAVAPGNSTPSLIDVTPAAG